MNNIINPPDGCRFHTKCPEAISICKTNNPSLLKISKYHETSCHIVNK